LLICNYSF